MSGTCLRFDDDINNGDVYYMINNNNIIFKIHLNSNNNKLLNIMDTILNRFHDISWNILLDSNNINHIKYNIIMRIKYIINQLSQLKVNKYLDLLNSSEYTINIERINDTNHWMNV